MSNPENTPLSTVYETWSKPIPGDSQERVWNRIVQTLEAPEPVKKPLWSLPVVYRSIGVACCMLLLITGIQWQREQQYRELANYVQELSEGNVTLDISDNENSIIQEI